MYNKCKNFNTKMNLWLRIIDQICVFVSCFSISTDMRKILKNNEPFDDEKFTPAVHAFRM